ncbi:MAG: septum formation initiator family protein [Actinobacteria bacterium]|nr:MAG: septum formation initiator family protein [Actinomycetota bacterium]
MPDQRRDSGHPGRRHRPDLRRARAGADPHRARTAGDPKRARGTAEPARSASRPAAARRAAAPGAAQRTTAPRPGRFTGRAATLALVLVALLLAYAYPVRIYLTQQAQIAALESSQNVQRARIQEKQTQVAKWNDKDYIIAMAHKRLQMVLPGDKAFVTGPAAGTPDPAADPNAGQAINTGPWYGKLWSSVRAADKPGTAP